MRKVLLFPLVAGLFLFNIPFFWLQPGWMDLGGDSSRLYFYDPINFLKSFPLYVIAPTGTSVLMIGQYLIPFVLLLHICKFLFQSPYLVITIFNSLQLIGAFFAMYLIIREFLKNTNESNGIYVSIISTVGGLFYALSPFLAPNGWDKAMFIHHQFFLNPLMFYFLLRFIHTSNFIYLLITVLTSFIFAANFSPGPPVFAFYPLAICYLLLYATVIRKTPIAWKKIFFAFFLFIVVQLFHLIPQLTVFLTDENSAYRHAAFSKEGKIDRGQGYFASIAQTYRFVNNLLAIPQGESSVPKLLEPFWFSIPFIFIVGLLLYKKVEKYNQRRNNFLLIVTFFLLILFLVTARVTDIGFSFYKSLFYIPGFSMFRNYLGQFSFVFIFFYTFVFAYSLFYLLLFLRKKIFAVVVVSIFIVLIVSSSISFIRGDMINLVQNKGFPQEITVPIIMDPQYEQALEYIRKLPTDGKFLSLPLTEGGIQIFAGMEGGAYQGPSTISYLTGKVDFAGRSGLYPFGERFLTRAKLKDYEGIQTTLSLLNVKYIFYNSDPYVFTNNFYRIPPYQEMHKYLPTTHEAYKIFIEQLDVKKKIDFGDKYHLYELDNTWYLPHVYTARKNIVVNTQLTEVLHTSLPLEDGRIAIIDNESVLNKSIKIDETYVYLKKITNGDTAQEKSALVLSESAPTEQLPLLYPFLSLPQQVQYTETSRIYDRYYDKKIYDTEKIVRDIEKNESNIDSLLNQYESLWKKIIDEQTKKNSFAQIIFFHSSSIRTILAQQENRLRLSPHSKKEVVDAVFQQLYTLLPNQNQVSVKMRYEIDLLQEGLYETFIAADEIRNSELSVINSSVYGKDNVLSRKDKKWAVFPSIPFEKGKKSFLFSIPWYITSEDVKFFNELDQNSLKNIFVVKGAMLRDYVIPIVTIFGQWRPNGVYFLSFDYTLQNGESKRYQALLKSGSDGTSAIFYIAEGSGLHFPIGQSEPPKLTIKNLSVIELPYPDVVLRKIFSQENENAPKLTFTKINPTKYIISVKNAHSPYTLVSLDAFHKDWKLFLSDDKKQKQGEVTVASYFNNDIKENRHENTFFNKNTFETWGKKPIASDKHFQVNGYANAWYITPEDVNSRQEYTLVLEMITQRSFYISLFVSLCGVFVCFLSLTYVIIAQTKQKNKI